MKLGPCARCVCLGATLFGVFGCGYEPAFARSPGERLTVVASSPAAPGLDALAATLAGARAELSRDGALAPGDGFPRLVVELVRVDEAPLGIRADPGRPPLARGASVGVTARGWVAETAQAPGVRQTGDVRRVAFVSQTGDAVPDGEVFDQAVTAAARAAGEGVARRALGIVAPAVEPM